MNRGEDAGSIDKIVSSVAADTGASAIKGVALAADLHANFIAVEHPVVGALEADIVVPVPSGASRV